MSEEIETEEQRRELMLEEVELLERKKTMEWELPHLYGFNLYKWADEFIESTNHECYLLAGNQLSKSSTEIRKCIKWATQKDRWVARWPDATSNPNLFWYLYPNKDVATEEFLLKWSEFMPRGSRKDCPEYGWKAVYKDRKIYKIEFNSGITVIFKSYAQNVNDLQTGTVFAIFTDEELPIHLLPELSARLNASDGYFNMVFTATIGQDYWKRVMEGRGDREEKPHADKWCVSMFDCQYYADGTPSPWTDEKIKRAIQKCSNKTEVARRIYGKFVVVGGLKYEAFDRDRCTYSRANGAIPSSWNVYTAVDIGSGGISGHPAAMVFVAVAPDYRQGRVFRGRRMDNIATTSVDILEEYRRVCGNLRPVMQSYDWGSAEFRITASRMGDTFVPAEKSADRGELTLNSLFKSGILKILDDDIELEKLMGELDSLLVSTNKKVAKDDFVDALRYAVMSIPWDWSAIDDITWAPNKIRPVKKQYVPTQLELRRNFALNVDTKPKDELTAELEEWQDMMDI